jgi:pyruvate kinase
LERGSSIATKIVCTIGPASRSAKVLASLIRRGMNVARLNFAHGDYNQHSKDIQNIRRVSKKLQRPVAILQDLPGPKLRVGKLKTDPLLLRRFDRVTLTTQSDPTEGEIPVSYSDLPRAVSKGDTVYMADGTIRLDVLKTKDGQVEGRVLIGGTLTSGKGVNIPHLRIRLPAVTREDVKHIAFGLDNDVDAVGVSFVQKVEDVRAARNAAQKRGRRLFVISKIEKREAVESLEPIVRESDGVMVARGDLGVEMSLERIPIIQKRIILEANKQGRPVITATQMLESMLNTPVPTRAEVADVANAILDGTDGVMLAEETAIGKYPVEAVEILRKVALETEKFLPKEISSERRTWHERSQEDAIALAACETALQISASAIVTPTRTGETARRVSKYHPLLPVVALPAVEKVRRQLELSWGVHPVAAGEADSMEELFIRAEKAAMEVGASKGDRIVIVAGDPRGPAGGTNLLKIHTVGERSSRS